MTKKEKAVDLKPKLEKISDVHLTRIQKVVNTINAIQFKFASGNIDSGVIKLYGVS